MSDSPSQAIPVNVAPRVSVIVPCRNEAGHIEWCLGSILGQEEPAGGFEVIVADGMSTDGTREIIQRISSKDRRVRFIDNPERIVSAGLNRAIEVARGETVIRVDGHAEVTRDFVRQNLAVLEEHPEAWSVGGPIVHEARTKLGKAIALAMCHPFGVGNAKHRFPGYEGYAEGAAFPAIRRWVFDRIGNFDEQLVRNQDDEFNYRIRQAGGRVFVSPRIRYRYFVRERLGQLFRQYFQYAFWRIAVIKKHGQTIAPRQFVPAGFLLSCLVLVLTGIALGKLWLGVSLPAIYAVGLALAGLCSVPQHGVGVAWRLPLAMATLHLAYGLGFLKGCWASLFNRDAWGTDGTMSALSR